MERPCELKNLEKPLLVRKVGSVKKIEGPVTRKKSAEIRLKKQHVTEDEIPRITETNMESGCTRRSVRETRGISMTPIRLTDRTPSTPIVYLPQNIGIANPNSPISALLYSDVNNLTGSARNVSTDPLEIRIYFPDQQGIRFDVSNGRQADAKFLLDVTADEIDLNCEIARQAFALWMVSPLLEVQLKPTHPPYEVRRQWANFLKKYTMADDDEILQDEPMLMMRRNVTLSLGMERNICMESPLACRLLFEDARNQFIQGRYAFDECKIAAEMAGLSMAAVFGTYPEELATLRNELSEHLPERHLSSVRGPLVFGRALSGTKELEETVQRMWRENGGDQLIAMRNYLARASQSPCYGCAFFSGYIERPNLTIKQLFRQNWFTSSNPSDIKVRIGVNMEWVSVTEQAKGELLLAQPIDACSWSRIEPNEQSDSEGETSLLLHFPENFEESCSSDEGTGDVRRPKKKVTRTNDQRPQETKILQIFGPQAVMIDALLNTMKARAKQTDLKSNNMTSSPDDGIHNESYEPSSASSNDSSTSPTKRPVKRQPSLTKVHKMCLATFDAHGKFLRAQGSLKKVLAN